MSVWQKISEKVSELGASTLSFLTGEGQPHEADPSDNVSFTIAVIALGAKMAKADGVVTEDEVEAFKQVFKVNPDQLTNVARVFNLAKKDVAGYDTYARQIADMFADKPEVLEDVVDSLFHIAKADNVIQDSELAFLFDVARIFGLEEKFRCIKARHVQVGDNDPYVVLGIDPCVDDRELKRLYREIIKENHPDRHIASGLPEEMVDVANQRLATINNAWEAIAKERGL